MSYCDAPRMSGMLSDLPPKSSSLALSEERTLSLTDTRHERFGFLEVTTCSIGQRRSKRRCMTARVAVCSTQV
jgi:hypothetical protein